VGGRSNGVIKSKGSDSIENQKLDVDELLLDPDQQGAGIYIWRVIGKIGSVSGLAFSCMGKRIICAKGK
jgi:hypothetical protein